jgi:hypothetical protein
MLKIPSVISKVSTMSDGSLRLQIDTQELAGVDKGELMELHNKMGWMVFSETGIKEEDIPSDLIEEGQKTPSQRLRAVLYVLWEKKQVGTFEDFYRKTLEKLIDHYKIKIEELS